MKKFKQYATLIGLTIGLLMLQIVHVFADNIPEGEYYLRNVNSDLTLCASGNYSGARLIQSTWDNCSVVQKYSVSSTADGYYSVSPSSNLNLAAAVINGLSSNCANIQFESCTGTDSQKWKFIYNGDGSFRVASKCSGDTKVMTVMNASLNTNAIVFQYQYNASRNDQWYLEACIEEGIYLIRNKKTKYFLTRNGDYMGQSIYIPSNCTNQKFKISTNSDGTYDIMPYSDTNLSVEVKGWDLGLDEENAKITASFGQNSEGQSWKFLLNGDGTYRIASQLSNFSKVVSAKGLMDSYLYSSTYSGSDSQSWELIKIDENDIYPKEGKYVKIDCDTEKYLQGNISVENLLKFLSHMDKAYEGYYELVGKKPQNGKKIIIVPSNDYSYPLWTYSGGGTIYWNANNFANDMSNLNDDNADDWGFGVLHEMGHLFDISGRWKFDAEFFANFKMAYLFEKYLGEIEVYQGGSWLTTPAHILKYYYDGSGGAYVNSLGATSKKYSNDGLTYMLLERIQTNCGWDTLKKTFRDFNTMSYTEIPTSLIDKYDKFLALMDKNSPNKDFLSNYLSTYSEQQKVIRNKFSNTGSMSIQELTPGINVFDNNSY